MAGVITLMAVVYAAFFVIPEVTSEEPSLMVSPLYHLNLLVLPSHFLTRRSDRDLRRG